MGTLAQVAIAIGILGTLGCAVVFFWADIQTFLVRYASSFRLDLEMAGMRRRPERYVLMTIGAAATIWTLIILLIHPSILIGIIMLVGVFGFTAYGARWYVRHCRQRRVAQFQEQLEQALRTLAGGVRVGLGIRQAFVMTAEQSKEPIHGEFMRVVGLNNVGVSLLDAFDEMAKRMTNPETAMLARILRVQSQTGGNLGAVLAGLANTIRDRRRLFRRVSAVTAQGRATGWLLGLLPVALGGFLVIAEPSLRDAMLFTLLGRIFLGIALALDALSIFSIMKIVQIDP